MFFIYSQVIYAQLVLSVSSLPFLLLFLDYWSLIHVDKGSSLPYCLLLMTKNTIFLIILQQMNDKRSKMFIWGLSILAYSSMYFTSFTMFYSHLVLFMFLLLLATGLFLLRLLLLFVK